MLMIPSDLATMKVFVSRSDAHSCRMIYRLEL